MNNLKKISGFTLIELIVVLSLMSILLIFSFPALKNIDLFSDSKTRLDDITRLINDLKKRALVQQVDFTLHIDTLSGIIWVTGDTMNDEAIESAKEKGVSFSEDITILDVEFPGEGQTGTNEYQIRFRKQGYSDFALIHLVNDEKDVTLRIEPFLSKVLLKDEHTHFENCM